ncbi:serine/arginine repetitive matrix protein 1-like [Ixodes scapularis]|uniref:serine/arginine repetitive matrix protein 1-like n=1 Tax=Ixodes scapularis TaxID=6945 RepID=UPI001A9E8ED4|nr:serine/arginine repetitive matrix protein 1-like [Ixodes scapularis]
MAAAQGRVPAEFLPTPGEPSMPWQTWKRGFLNYLEAIDAEDFPPKRKRAILFSFLGDEGNRVVEAFNLASPAVNAAQDEFQRLLSALDTHFASAQNVVVERRKFAMRFQGPEETVLEYLGALRRLASFCDYGESLESRVAEMFISGIRNAEVQDRLIRESDGTKAPSLERAVQLAQQFERASRDCDHFRRLSLDASPNTPHVVDRIQDGRGRDRNGQHGGQSPRHRGSSSPRRERLPPSPSPSTREPSRSCRPRREPPPPSSGRELRERPFPPFPPRRERDRRQSRAPSRPFFRARPRDPPPGARRVVRDDGCFFCGRRSHPRDECPASGATCFSCGREGHFANVCRSRPRHDRDHRQLALPAGRRVSARGYYEHRQARPGPTRTPIQGITFPDYELPATIYTVAPPDDFPERCRFCGGPCHPRKFCPAAHRRCFSCQKQGHLDRVCESRPRWPRLDRGGPSNPPTVFASAHRRHPAPPEPPVPVLGPASPDTTNPDPAGQRPDPGLSPEAPPSPPEGPVPAGSPLPEGPAEVQPVPVQPPVSGCSVPITTQPKPFPRPEPPEPQGPDASAQECRRRLPDVLKDYFINSFGLGSRYL